MATINLSDKDADALVSILSSLHFEPSFLADLKVQVGSQNSLVQEVVQEVKADDTEEVLEKVEQTLEEAVAEARAEIAKAKKAK